MVLGAHAPPPSEKVKSCTNYWVGRVKIPIGERNFYWCPHAQVLILYPSLELTYAQR